MNSTIKVCWVISGEDVDFRLLSSRLGINPTRIRNKYLWPQVSIETGIAHDEWIYEQSYVESHSVSNELDKFRTLISGKEKNLQKILEDDGMKSTVVVSVRMEVGNEPEISVSVENLNFLSCIKSELCFNIEAYCNG